MVFGSLADGSWVVGLAGNPIVAGQTTPRIFDGNGNLRSGNGFSTFLLLTWLAPALQPSCGGGLG